MTRSNAKQLVAADMVAYRFSSPATEPRLQLAPSRSDAKWWREFRRISASNEGGPSGGFRVSGFGIDRFLEQNLTMNYSNCVFDPGFLKSGLAFHFILFYFTYFSLKAPGGITWGGERQKKKFVAKTGKH